MIINQLKLENFRNHANLYIELPHKLYIEGMNGMGKTSIIEALYLLLTFKTFRAQLSEVKKINTQYLKVIARADYEETEILYTTKRTITVDGDKSPDLTFKSYRTPVICYSPEYETILSSQQNERRNILDRVLFYLDIKYLDLIKKYNSLLKRKRSELLNPQGSREVLLLLTEQMEELSVKISTKRRDLVQLINDRLGRDSVAKKYMSEYYLSFKESKIDLNLISGEIKAKRPVCGCHRDTLHLFAENSSIEKFQSFGQRKTSLLILLYQLTTIINEAKGMDVTLLLDDFEAGIDSERRIALFELFENFTNSQLILTGLGSETLSNSIEILKI